MDTATPPPAPDPAPVPSVQYKDTWRRGTTRASRGAKPTALVMDGRTEWRDWARQLARADGRPLSRLVADLLAEHATRIGQPDPPDRL